LRRHAINLKRTEHGDPPGNIVLFRGPASLAELPSFKTIHGLAAFMIAPTCLIAGIGLSLGMDLIKVPGATGDYRSDIGGKFRAALSLLDQDEYQFGFVHIKGADEMSHSGEPVQKRVFIEKVDEELGVALRAIREELHAKLIIAVTGDHTTPSYWHNDHTHHPVPFLVSSLVPHCAIKPDAVIEFDEIAVSNGRLNRFTGLAVMGLIKKLLGIA
jgi:2,3-diphosphopglycerate-independent phosphoglycerate mutase